MAWHFDQAPRGLDTLGDIQEGEGPRNGQRSLHRVLAVAVAIAAISPLFAADSTGCARSLAQKKSIQLNQAPPPAGHTPR